MRVLRRASPASAPAAARPVATLRALAWKAVPAILAAALAACTPSPNQGASVQEAPAEPERQDWVQLFNGRDLTGWKIKFANHPVGENLNETFRVEDGILRVAYDRWPGWTGEMGHIISDTALSHYIVRVEYRFTGEQVAGADLGWAVRNNGVMLHAQGAEEMAFEQGYPNSMEVQLLGGLGDGNPRTTANLCTPGTVFERDGVLDTTHCVNSTSATYDGDVWVRAEALVLGDSIVKHIVEGDTVFVYTRPQVGEREPRTPLTRGHIALQAESAPTDFRRIEVLDLEGCMDPESPSYRSYFVKANPARCSS